MLSSARILICYHSATFLAKKLPSHCHVIRDKYSLKITSQLPVIMTPALQPCHNVVDFGAMGDGVKLDHVAFNHAISACHHGGGGTVLVPAGIYLVGTIELLGHVNLHLAAGAVIKGSPHLTDYRVLPYSSELRNTTLILADGATNIGITGLGTIDGNGSAFAIRDQADLSRDFDAKHTRQGEAYYAINDLPDDGPVKHHPRPGMLILIKHCRDVTVRDIKIIDAPNWNLHVACCADVSITGLDIKASMVLPNSSGLDISLTRNVRISDCNIESGDDAIAFSPCADGFGDGVAENIVVQNCVLLARSAAIRIGWGMHDFRNLLFNNIVIRESNRGIVINLRHGETVENVIFSNIVIETRLYKGKWWGKGEPIHISVIPEFENERRARVLRNVTFSNITATGDHGIVLYAEGQSTLEHVVFDNCRLMLRRGPLQESFGGNFDLRPFWDSARKVFEHDIPALYACGVKALMLRNMSVNWDEGLPAFVRHAFEIENFEEVTIDGFRGRQARVGDGSGDATIILRNGRNAVMRNAVLTAGSNELLAVDNVEDLQAEPARRVEK